MVHLVTECSHARYYKYQLTILVLPHRTESKPELVKTEMGPPPSPASTCSDTSSIASSASLPYSMSASLLLSLPLNLKLSRQHSSLDFPLYLPGTEPISSSLCALISPLTLKQMVHRLLSASFFFSCLFSCERSMISSQYILWCVQLPFYLLISYEPYGELSVLMVNFP